MNPSLPPDLHSSDRGLPSSARRERRFVLLDRDGVVIVDKDYLAEPAGVELLPHVGEGLRRLRDLGLGLVIVTNQSGVGRGYFTLAQMHAVHQRLREILAAEGVSLEGIYFCPHGPQDDCRCRKPAVGLAEQAVADWGFVPSRAFVVGDKASDLRFARTLGAKALLATTGYGAETLRANKVPPDAVVADLRQAADYIAIALAEPAPTQTVSARRTS